MQTDIQQLHSDILSTIHDAEHIMLVMHRSPDGDTAGAALALSNYLDEIGKDHTCFCADPLSDSFRYLPGYHRVTDGAHHWHPEHAQFDVVVVLDSGDPGRAGIDAHIEGLNHDVVIVNIDHHKTNTRFGHHNLVLPDASSTCEMVHDLLHTVDGLSKNVSTCLMTGLITDTGHFLNGATTATSIGAASNLLSRGVNMRSITNRMMNNRPINQLRLWGRALERLTTTKYGIAYTALTRKDMQECGVTADAIEGIANFLNSLDDSGDIHTILVLTEREPGVVKGSFRTTNPLIDVSSIATLLGGGGHAKAAGFSVSGSLVEENGRWIIKSS